MITRFSLFLVAFSSLACAKTSPDTLATDIDSVAIDSVPQLPQQEPALDSQNVVTNVEPDSADIAGLIDRARERAVNEESKYYVVTITTRQYEASSSVTWHFDKDISPRYFNEDWSMEGNEGSMEIMVSDGDVTCVVENEPNTEVKWCSASGGIKTVWNEESGEALSEDVADNYGDKYAGELTGYLNTLKQILQEAKLIEESSGGYVLRIEQTVDVGMEVTESTEVDIPKDVYNFLTK